MRFDIEHQSDNRQVRTDVSGVHGDNVNISRDPFQIEPTKNNNEPEVGMDFLVDSEEESEHQEQDTYDENNDSGIGEGDGFENTPVQETYKTYEEIQQEKSYYLSQLKRLEKKGNVASRRFCMEHSLDEIRGEVIRIKKEIDIDNSIGYMRQGLMFCVSTIEMAEGKYVKPSTLAGWSQNIMGNIESYDSVFEELYDKYSNSVKVMPELKLMSMLAGSAFLFGLQKKMLGEASSPPPRQREMDGPSMDTDDLLRRLNEVDIDDDISDISDSTSGSVKISTPEPKTKTINIKKRGRPPKKI